MNVTMSGSYSDPIQQLSKLISSERFFALSTTILLHLTLVVLIMAGWVADKPAEPISKSIKVEMFVMPASENKPQIALEKMQEMPASPPKEMQKKAITEAPFAKKRVEDLPSIETKELTEPMPEVSPQDAVDASEKLEKTSEVKTAVNAEANRTNEHAVSKENASTSSAEQKFDASHYSPLQKEAPVYPQRALDKGVQGTCTIQYTVNTQGLVENPVALDDCHALFIKPSLEATKSFRYSPRMIDGQAVKVSNVKNTFKYRIE